MPSWKRVITSGSAAALSSLLLTDGLEVTGSVQITGSLGLIGPLTVSSSQDSYVIGSGNVGIGTTSPAYKLDVNGQAQFVNGIVTNTGTPVKMIVSGGILNDSTEFRTGNGEFKIYSGRFNAAHQSFVFATGDNYTSGAERMRITSSGNVGIGTTSPGSKLHVNGDVQILNNLYFVDSNNKVVVDQSAGTAFDFHLNTQNIASLERYSTDSGQFQIKQYSTGNTADNAPAYSFKGDTNTGMALFGVDSLALVTGGDTKLIVNAAGNVGIGTTSPLSRLHVSDSSGGVLYLQDSDATSTYNITSLSNNGGNLSFDTRNSSGVYVSTDYQIVKDAGGANYQRWFTSATERIRITSTGNVGIGTTSPNQKLEVAGRVRISTDPTVELYNTSANRGGVQWVDGSLMTKIFSGGSSGAGAGIIFETNTTEKMRITSAGNVGIGTTSPSYKLAVYGSTSGSEIVASFGNGNASNEYTAIGLSGFIASNGATKAGLALKRTDIYGTGELHFLNNNTLDNSDITLSDSKMMINASGNVGIGTTSPERLLSLYSNDTGTTPRLLIEQAGTGDAVMAFSLTSGQGWSMGIDNSLADAFMIHNSAGGVDSSSQFAILTGGNVGIGTTSPGARLEVKGSDGYLKFDSNGDNGFIKSDFNLDLYADDTANNSSGYSNIRFFTYGASEKMRITSAGNVGIGTTSPVSKLTVVGDIMLKNPNGANPTDAGSFIFNESGTTWGTDIYGFRFNLNGSSNVLTLQSANTTTVNDIISFTRDSASVGIGTTAPGYKLDVSGSGNFTGDLTVTGSLISNSLTVQDITVLGTASIAYLDVTFESASVIYSSGSNIFGDADDDVQTLNGDVVVNGTDFFVDASTSRVGIGTTSPSATLDVSLSSGATSGIRFKGYSDAGTPYLLSLGTQTYQDIFQIKSVNGLVTMGIVGNVGAAPDLAFQTNTTERMRITSGGVIAIGTSTPNGTVGKLEMGLDGAANGIGLYNGTGTSLRIWRESDIGNIGRGATPSISINASGNVGIGTTSPTGGALVVNVTAAAATADISAQATGTIAFSDNGANEPAIIGKSTANNTNGLYVIAAASDTNSDADFQLNVREDNNSDFSTLTTRAFDFTRWTTSLMTILRNGNVGIGTSTPDRRLHVNSGSDNANAIFESTDTAVTIRLKDLTGSAEIESRNDFRFSNNAGVDQRMVISSAGAIKFNNYDSTNQTGTPTYLLGTDASGNIVKTNTVPGSAAGPYLPLAGGTMSGAIQIPDATNIQFIGASGDHSRIVYTQGNGTTGDVWSHAFYQNSSYLAGIDFYSTTEALADGNIRFRTGGTSDRMTILTGGNVGIGTTNPLDPLNVQSTGASDYAFRIFRSTSTTQGLAGFYEGSANQGQLYLLKGDNTAGVLLNSSGDSYLNGGNVGIGTATPNQGLHVKDSGAIVSEFESSNNSISTIEVTNSSGNSSYFGTTGTSLTLGAGTYDSNDLVITTAGNVGIGTTSPSELLEVVGNIRANVSNGGGFMLTGASASGLVRAGATGLALRTDTTDRLTIDNSGNVGIGTASPNVKLEVNGGIRTTGADGNIDADPLNGAFRFYGPGGFRGGLYNDQDLTGGTGSIDDITTYTSAGSYHITVGATSNKILTASGSAVGIGVETPTQKLHVAGNARITGAVYDSTNSAGTSGQVFSSTATGTNWVGASGLPGGPYLPLAGGTMTGDLKLNDNVDLYIGTGDDFQAYHDGSNTYLRNLNGNLVIKQDKVDADLILESDNGSGGTTPYLQLDGSHTQSIAWKDLHFADGSKAKFGDYASPDLQIYHDGSNSYINETGTGVLSIQSDGTEVQINNGASEYMARFITDGAVNLYYDNSKKFETTSTGVTVTGDVSIVNANISNQEGTIPIGTTTVASVSSTTYSSMAIDYVVKNGLNLRSGTIIACHDGTNTVYTETSTPDIGSTTDITFAVAVSGADFKLEATVLLAGWTVKTLVRAL